MTSISKMCMLINWEIQLINIAIYYHITIKIKPVDINSSTFNDSSMGNNEKDPSFIIS